MGFLSSIFRQSTYQDAGSFSSPSGWLVKSIGGTKTAAGTRVSEYNARQLPVVYACVNRIGNPIAWFPMRMYRTRRGGGKEVVPGGNGPGQHPFAARIGVRPNDLMTSRTLRKTVQGHALLWGNGYIEVERNGRGQSVGLYPLLPDRTAPVRENGNHWFRTRIDGKQVDLESDNVIHIMDQSQDGFVGISQISMASQAIGWGMAMEQYGSKFFANDAKSGGFLMHPGRLNHDAKRNIRGRDGESKAGPENPAASIERQSGLENAHKIKVLEEGMKFIQTSIPPEDAQFLGSREFQIAEIARIYDVPLILLQSQEKQTSFGSGVEQLMIGFIRQTVGPWVDAWEQELNWKLFTDEERDQGYYIKLNMNALLRGDMKARADFYQKVFSVGGFSPNRILELEDEDPIGPEGDHHFVPSNFVTLDRATDPDYQPSGDSTRTAPSDDQDAEEKEADERDERDGE